MILLPVGMLSSSHTQKGTSLVCVETSRQTGKTPTPRIRYIHCQWRTEFRVLGGRTAIRFVECLREYFVWTQCGTGGSTDR